MRLSVLNGRAVVVDGTQYVDVGEASSSAFGPDIAGLYDRWAEFRQWASTKLAGATRKTMPAQPAFGLLSPRARQSFGIGVNYSDHAGESGIAVPPEPMVFTKFASCLVGPTEPLRITLPTVDWEVELVLVIGAAARDVTREAAWSHVAGLTIGQDISDRKLQMLGSHPQFSLAKSRPGYGPIGPYLVTTDELKNRDDLDIRCTLNGEEVQHSRTSKLINDVPRLVSYLSSVLELFPGDVVFTGTPAGVGFVRTPPRYLAAGDVLVSTIEGLGELRTVTVGPKS
jgi:2,4-diketo-3-deoxy-L-fuconate hydrolase